MAKYIPYDDDEKQLIPINFKAQLQRGSFEYALHNLIENKYELFAIDGCKLSSNAVKTWLETHQKLKHKQKKLKKLSKYHVTKDQVLDQANAFEVEEAVRIEQSIETLEKVLSKTSHFKQDKRNFNQS